MGAHQILAPREIARVLNRRKVLQRADLTAGDEGLDGEPTQVRRGGLDLRSQPTLRVVEFVSAEHHVEQVAFGGRPLGECLRSQLGDLGLLGSQVVAGGNVAAQIVDGLGRGTECVRGRHDGEHGEHSEQTPQSGQSRRQGEIFRTRLAGRCAGSRVRCWGGESGHLRSGNRWRVAHAAADTNASDDPPPVGRAI